MVTGMEHSPFSQNGYITVFMPSIGYGMSVHVNQKPDDERGSLINKSLTVKCAYNNVATVHTETTVNDLRFF